MPRPSIAQRRAIDGRPYDLRAANAGTDMANRMARMGAAGQWPGSSGAVDGRVPHRQFVAAHGQPAARRQRAVHDRDGDEDARSSVAADQRPTTEVSVRRPARVASHECGGVGRRHAALVARFRVGAVLLEQFDDFRALEHRCDH